MTDIDHWSLLERYLAGSCSAPEQARVEGWLAAAPANRQTLDAMRQVVTQADRTLAPDRQAELAATLRRRIIAAQPARPARPTPILAGQGRGSRDAWWAMKIAAAVLLLLGASLAGYLMLRHSAELAVIADRTPHPITTARGQRLAIRLPDGTLAVLAPASTLCLASGFGAKDRVVQLEGEAAFTVTHDAARPFAVRTAKAEARDIGTRFVVRAYADNPATDVVVAEGKVAVSRPAHSSDSLVLTRGERARLTSDGAPAVSQVALDEYFAWTDGQLLFRRTPLREAIAQIERWHDVEIRLASPELATRSFSATFEHGGSAAEVLQVIAAVLKLEVTQTGRRSYVLHAR